MTMRTCSIHGNQRYSWIKYKRSLFVSRTRLCTMRHNTTSWCRSAAFSASSRLFDLNDAAETKQSSTIIVSPNGRRVGIRIVTFEACSGFTHVTAHRIAQPPKAAFVTRLQPCRLPDRTARQLPDQSTTLWVESSSTSDPRLRGALPTSDMRNNARPAAASTDYSSNFNMWPRLAA